MARDNDSILQTKWGDSQQALVGTADDDQVGTLQRRDGYPDSYRQIGGDKPQLTQFNQILNELYAIAVEVNRRGAALEWSSDIQYTHPACVIGANGIVYSSVQDSENRNPVGDNAQTYWKKVGRGDLRWINTVNYQHPSIVENAGDLYITTNPSINVVPSTDYDYSHWKPVSDSELAWRSTKIYSHPTLVVASNGIIYTSVRNSHGNNPVTDSNRQFWRAIIGYDVASNSEVIGGTVRNKIVSPSGLQALTSTESRRGIIEIATQNEADAGVDDQRALTPFKAKNTINKILDEVLPLRFVGSLYVAQTSGNRTLTLVPNWQTRYDKIAFVIIASGYDYTGLDASAVSRIRVLDTSSITLVESVSSRSNKRNLGSVSAGGTYGLEASSTTDNSKIFIKYRRDIARPGITGDASIIEIILFNDNQRIRTF